MEAKHEHVGTTMTLQTELDTFKAAWLERVGTATAELVDHDIAALQALAGRAIKAGAQFPAMSLPDQDGQLTDVGELYANQPLVVVFYRGGWCPYCNLELRAYERLIGEFRSLGAALIAVSPETPDHALSTAEANSLHLNVLSDSKGRLADALGIRFELSPEIRALYQRFGHDLPARNGDDVWSLPMPATYVVDRGGRIALASVDPDYRKRLNPLEALTTLRNTVGRNAAGSRQAMTAQA